MGKEKGVSLGELAAAIHANAREKGFWDKERNVGELLMLVVSELGEALEAHRSPGAAAFIVTQEDKAEALVMEGAEYAEWYQVAIKGSFEEEIADAIIRLLDLSAGLGIDIEWEIKAKMKYNATRERMHGKSY
jgi:NTP pyrophosphatase (non-canonical NTP hydrolase)